MISNALYDPNAVYDHQRYMLVKLCVDADRDQLKKHQPRAASHSLNCCVKDCMRCFMQMIEVIVSAHPQSRFVVRTCAACSNFGN